MNYLIKDITNLVTCKSISRFPKKGKEQSDIGLIKNGNVLIENGKITFAGKSSELNKFLINKKINYKEIDGKNKTVMPGFVDSHTHLVFAGSRSDEYEMKIKGSTYEDIAKAGGGIANTVKAVRNISKEMLIELSEKRLRIFFRYGTTTIKTSACLPV